MSQEIPLALEANNNPFTDRYTQLTNTIASYCNNIPFLTLFWYFILGKLLYVFCYSFLIYQGKINPGFVENVCQWDCKWYRSIIYHGYEELVLGTNGLPIPGQKNWAFFPLFPLVNKALLAIFHSEISILVLNQLLLFASMVLLYTYCLRTYSKQIAYNAALILGLSCENVYLLSLYTEAIFLFLTLVALHFIIQKRYLYASLCCCLLSATRVQGFLMLFPVLFAYLQDCHFTLTLKRGAYLVCLTMISILGLVSFMIFLNWYVHDYLAFYHIQVEWGRFHTSWAHPFTILSSLRGSVFDISATILTLPVLYYFYRAKHYNEFIFLGLCFLIVIASQSAQSYFRFFFINFASYVFFAQYSARSKIRYYFIITLTVLLNILFTFFWLTGKRLVT